MENDGLIVLVPLTKKEYRDAKSGKVLQKRCTINGNDCCILITNHFVSYNESKGLLKSGFDIFPVDLSEINWWDIDRTMRYNIILDYSCGISLCIISQNMYHQLQKEREDDNDRDRKAEENKNPNV